MWLDRAGRRPGRHGQPPIDAKRLLNRGDRLRLLLNRLEFTLSILQRGVLLRFLRDVDGEC